MTLSYPPAWTSLRYPWVRAELQDYLAELSNPVETAKWLKPSPQGLVIGIEQQFHFFFDDHDFDAGEIGYSLFDEAEVAAIAAVKEAMQAIHRANKTGDDRYFLDHPLWPSVANAAATALILFNARGVVTE